MCPPRGLKKCQNKSCLRNGEKHCIPVFIQTYSRILKIICNKTVRMGI